MRTRVEREMDNISGLIVLGNVIYVAPDKNVVVAITSRFKSRAADRIEFIEKVLFPEILEI